MKISIFPSAVDTARKLIVHLVDIMNAEPARVFNIALSGGTTSALMFDLWANEYANITPWGRLRVFWVDERCVPPEDSDSNYGMARTLLLGAVPIPYNEVYRIHGECKSAKKEAQYYSELVREKIPQKNGWPEFDIVLLGAGEDGHTSSIFPGQEELLTADVPYAASINPRNGQKRIAMTGYPIINARHVFFLIVGKNKADTVEEMYQSGEMGPAAYIAHHAPNVELFLDSGAAKYLPDEID